MAAVAIRPAPGRRRAALPHPPELVLELLQGARDGGQRFEDAWPDAVCAALGGLNRVNRGQWECAFQATGAAWERAFDGEPATTADLVAGRLHDALDGE